MKDILAKIDPEVHRNSNRLRKAVLEAWGSITDVEVRDIIHEMPRRCIDCKNGNGLYTKW